LDRLKADLEAEIQNLWDQYNKLSDIADLDILSQDAVKYQIKLRGRIEGLEYCLAMMRRMGLT